MFKSVSKCIQLFVVSLLVGCAGSDSDTVDAYGFITRDAAARIIIDGGAPGSRDGASMDAHPTDTGRVANVDMGVDSAIEEGDEGCIRLSGCLAACSDPECSVGCRMEASDGAADLYDAIYSCAVAYECTIPGGGYDPDCMSMNCDGELRTCLGPPPPGLPPPMGQMTCQELEDCLVTCETGDVDCRDACVTQSSQAGFDQLVAVQECVGNHECVDGAVACVLRTCEPAFSACYGPVVLPMGEADCTLLNTCLGECAAGDRPCTDTCFRASGDDGYNDFQSLVTCVQATQCMPDDGECQRAACGPEFEACFGPPAPAPMGTMDCGALNECIQTCEPDDRVCVNNCIGRSTQAAYDALLAAYDCLGNTQCADDDAECRQMACQVEIEACLGPPVMPMGNMNCSQFNNCLVGCADNDQGCTDDCVRAASVDGYQRFNTAIDCIQDAGCMPEDVDCQQQNCADEISACLAP